MKDTFPDYFNLIFAITLLAQWLIYVEYTLHQSRDLINESSTLSAIFFTSIMIYHSKSVSSSI